MENVLGHIGLSSLVPMLQRLQADLSIIQSKIQALITYGATCITNYCHLAPWLSQFLSEAFWLWVAIAIVVIFASWYHHSWSTRERAELGERAQRQKTMREKHFT